LLISNNRNSHQVVKSRETKLVIFLNVNEIYNKTVGEALTVNFVKRENNYRKELYYTRGECT
jgi:hypothetical protein